MESLFGRNQQMSNLLLQFLFQSKQISQQEKLKNHMITLKSHLYMNDDPRIYDALVKDNYPEMLVYTFSRFRGKDPELVETLLNLLVTITNNSVNFCSALMKTDLPNLLVEESLTYYDEKNLKRYETCFPYHLCIIFNIVRVAEFRKYFLRNAKIGLLKNKLPRILTCNIEYIKILSMLTLACLKEGANDEKVLLGHFYVVVNISRYLSNAIVSEDRAYEGYDIWELLLGLKELSSITAMKPQLITIPQFVNTINTIISTKSSKPKEVEVALEILKILRADEEMAKINFKFESVTKITDSKDKEKDQKSNRLSEDLDYDVFISYSAADREIMEEVENILKQKVKVCMGRMREEESTRSHGEIDQSRIVLLGLSPSYQDNCYCTSAAAYAISQNKPIISLLLLHKFKARGILNEIVQKFPAIEFSDMTKFKEALAELYKHISEHPGVRRQETSFNQAGGTTNITRIGGVAKHEGSSTILTLLKSRIAITPTILNDWKEPSTNKEKHFSRWDVNEVSLWLKENKLSDVSYKFKEFDGELIKKLKYWQNNSKEMYNEHLKTSMKLDFLDILKLDVALDKLPN